MQRTGRRRKIAKYLAFVGLLVVVALVAVVVFVERGVSAGPPSRATAVITPPAVSSDLVVPVVADLGQLEHLLNQEIPLDLWQIDQPGATCLAPRHITLFGAHLAVTPPVRCHITGKATRGAVTLHGEGQTLIADVPILAHVEANQIGGMVSAHADGQAMAHARINLTVARDWQVSGKIKLAYDWASPPSIAILGQHIAFTDQADQRLKPVIADLERKLPATLAGLNLRARIAQLWQSGFTVISLNGNNPPVWMRIVPQKLSYGGYTVAGNQMQLQIGLTALTQAMIGPRPDNPSPTPLPDMARQAASDGAIHMFVPVIADYADLVPVLARALDTRSTRPFNLPGLGAVDAHFSNIEVYGASHGRIAVGADVAAVPRFGLLPATHGRIWFAGKPHNGEGSQQVHFSDLSVSGATDYAHGNLLIAIANSPGFSDTVASALSEDFTRDYAKLEDKIRRAIADRPQGGVRLQATLETARNGAIEPAANGLYMPVWLTGRARLSVLAAPDAR